MMFEYLLSSDITQTWAFLLSFSNGVIGLPPSELLSFKAAQAEAKLTIATLFLVMVVGSVTAGFLMFLFGRSLKSIHCFQKLASRVIKIEHWPSISEGEYYRAILFGRLTPGIRSQIPMLAGFLGGNFRIFWRAHFLGTFIWYGFWVGLSKGLLILTLHSNYKTVHVFGLLAISMIVVHAFRYFLPIMRKVFRIICSPTR